MFPSAGRVHKSSLIPYITVRVWAITVRCCTLPCLLFQGFRRFSSTGGGQLEIFAIDDPVQPDLSRLD